MTTTLGPMTKRSDSFGLADKSRSNSIGVADKSRSNSIGLLNKSRSDSIPFGIWNPNPNRRDSMNQLYINTKFFCKRLIPYYASLPFALYFVIHVPIEEPSTLAMWVKCLPNLFLCLFVALSDTDDQSYSRKILMGLVASSVADAYLAWPKEFFYAIVGYGVAQIFYISALGLDRMNWKLGKFIYAINCAVLLVILPGLFASEFRLMMAVIVYSFLLMTMFWSAFSKVTSMQDMRTWTIFFSCIGGLGFAISDLFIGLDRFYTKMDHAEVILMVSYYVAQFGLAMSIFQSKAGQITYQVRSSDQ